MVGLHNLYWYYGSQTYYVNINGETKLRHTSEAFQGYVYRPTASHVILEINIVIIFLRCPVIQRYYAQISNISVSVGTVQSQRVHATAVVYFSDNLSVALDSSDFSALSTHDFKV